MAKIEGASLCLPGQSYLSVWNHRLLESSHSYIDTILIHVPVCLIKIDHHGQRCAVLFNTFRHYQINHFDSFNSSNLLYSLSMGLSLWHMSLLLGLYKNSWVIHRCEDFTQTSWSINQPSLVKQEDTLAICNSLWKALVPSSTLFLPSSAFASHTWNSVLSLQICVYIDNPWTVLLFQ